MISSPVPTIQYSTVLSVPSSGQHTSTYNTVQYGINCTIIWSAQYGTVLSIPSSDQHLQHLQFSRVQCFLYHHLISSSVPTIQYSTVLSVQSSDKLTSTYNTVQYTAICTIIWSAPTVPTIQYRREFKSVLFFSEQNSAIQYRTIIYNTEQYNMIQYSKI